ncbi:hypothetical protein [Virgibacillus ihumii]|uniref:hypothetical protein n=1 Tax=Virgibacillus ihumii TaxID=2686091 RepID=UPI001FEB234B|nr:hypothetical protein [Virgibacillus ihumii]
MSHLKAVPDEQTVENPAQEETETSLNQKETSKKPKKKWFQRKPKKTTEKNQQKKKKAPKPKVLRQTTEILPFLQIHDDYILMKHGVMDIFQVETKNIHALNDQDINFLLLNRARFLRSYFQSYKEVILNFPASTEKQRHYWLKKAEKTANPIHLKYIEQKLYEFDYVEEERSNREFFFFVYGNDREELTDRKNDCLQGMNQAFPLRKLSRAKKEQVLFLLNNQNTKL